MNFYSIKELEQLSGIKAHTIRIWEKRYNILNPDRSEGNVRRYSNDDLKRLLNLAYLNQQGIKISKLAKYEDIDFERCLDSARNQDGSTEKYLNKMLLATLDIDEENFYATWNAAILDMSFEGSIRNLIFPLLTKIGSMWLVNKIGPYQEHFVSHLIRSKVITATSGLEMQNKKNAKSWILYLPDGEWHELGILLYNYLLRKAGQKTYYLGQSVPEVDIKNIVEAIQPDYLFTSHLAIREIDALNRFTAMISNKYQDNMIFISLDPNLSTKAQCPDNVKFIGNPEDIQPWI